ncbi:uncharacterized protein DEA37_0011024 [Paragonimus westermani]|uniref:Fibronectin type-III domain-containing protein n=1 Tax=Paragonimus westermani TaxID=34504 RepID=A0A5J4NPF7_9TREM|nr:uncharacterized protein DEA37_0011024 [Paragonimus westermani]
MVAGAYRPPMLMLKDYTDSSGRANASLGLTERWTEDTVNTARNLAKKLIFMNRWSEAHLLDDVVANSQLIELSDNNTRQTRNNSSTAIVRIYADVVYHFRIRLENQIGLSDPSEIAPSLDAPADSLCYLPPQSVSMLPKDMIVYGNRPTNLIVKWLPIPPAEHNGPGLQYYLAITCLDCLLGPTKPLMNITRITDWSVGELKVEQLITRESTGAPDGLGRLQYWKIETFRTYENLIIRKPPSWSAAALRTSNDLNQSDDVVYGSLTERVQLEAYRGENTPWGENVNTMPVKSKQAEIDFINNSYVARIVGIPGKTRLNLIVRVLNVQHAGAPSTPIYLETKEGVPEAVPEFITTLVGVNHVELAWVKPMRTNGVLTSYELEVYEDNAHPYFMINPIVDDQNSVNVCLARKLNGPVDHAEDLMLNLNRGAPTESSATRLSDTEPQELLSFEQKHSPTWQNEQHLSSVDTKAVLKSVGPKHSDMFYAQFRKVGEVNWEETQREFQKPWIILSNLVPGTLNHI